MSTMASQITSLTIVYSVVYSRTRQRKHQSPASLAFVRGIHRWPVNFPHKGPAPRKIFPFDDVIMISDYMPHITMCEITYLYRNLSWTMWVKGGPCSVLSHYLNHNQAPSNYLSHDFICNFHGNACQDVALWDACTEAMDITFTTPYDVCRPQWEIEFDALWHLGWDVCQCNTVGYFTKEVSHV